MSAQRLKQIEEIFLAAVDVLPAEREAFFREHCGNDADLRREVESLLTFENTSDSFLDKSPEALAAEMFTDQDNKTILIDKEIGHYKIKQLLGKGGMGEVYLAEDTRLNRRVALKFLSVSTFDDKNVLRRFKQEAFAASALNHPNVLTIYEFEASGNVCYLATEYIEGETLRARMNRGQLSPGEALNIAEQIASALATAHKANIIHRDIKPENIMLREDGFVKILDFGLAKLTGREANLIEDPETRIRKIALTRTGSIMGTTFYMSPEQIRGRSDIDARADIWSLGIVLFEMLTGHVPFTGDTMGDTIASILTTDVPHLSEMMVDCPSELERIINKSLAKNVETRYQQIRDMARDIKSLKSRLEFEAELQRSNSRNKGQINSPKSNRIAATNNETVELSALPTRIIPATVSKGTQPETARNSYHIFSGKSRPLVMIPIFALILLTGVIGSIVVWRYGTSGAASQPTMTTISPNPDTPGITKPSLLLNYSLTVQSYNDGHYKSPFKLSGEMLFRNKDRVRLNIKSPQTGYLYILNESPKDEAGESSFNILFPSPTTNNGASYLVANAEIQIPEQSWFELDTKEGTELVWLVWSQNPLAELESAKRFANPTDKGKIKDPALVKSISSLLLKYQSNKGNVERDDDKKESQITANTDILTHVIKLEHH